MMCPYFFDPYTLTGWTAILLSLTLPPWEFCHRHLGYRGGPGLHPPVNLTSYGRFVRLQSTHFQKLRDSPKNEVDRGKILSG